MMTTSPSWEATNIRWLTLWLLAPILLRMSNELFRNGFPADAFGETRGIT